MRDEEVWVGWLTLEQAAARATEPLLANIGEGQFPHSENVTGVWRFSAASLLRGA